MPGSRRWKLRQRIPGMLVGSVLIVVASQTPAPAQEDARYGGWFFTADEVAAAYQYQQNYGERLSAPLRAGSCLFRNGEFAAVYHRIEFPLGCHFISEVSRHLKEMLEVGAAKFLFPLDADHAHLGVPLKSWNEKYKHLPAEKVFPAILRDPGLVALYHTAEHLQVTDRKTGAVNGEAKAWHEKRNVLGYFNGRPITILSPDASGRGAPMPEAYYSYGGFSFLASPRGELYLSVVSNMITFDIAFDSSAVDESETQNTLAVDKRVAQFKNAGARPARPKPAK